MKIIIKGNSKKRVEIRREGNREKTEAVIQELRKTSRKLRRLLKNGFEIDLTISSENNYPEEE